MYTFTDSNGYTTDAPVFDAVAANAIRASDVRLIPVWLAAAEAADEAGHCPEYDNLAESIGAPTRDDLRQAGYLTRDFDVTYTRRVAVTVYVNQRATATVTASNPRGAREAWEEGNVDIEWPELDYYSVRDNLERYQDFEADEDSEENVEVERVETA